MGLSERYLPRATPLDPAEDPPGSIDPLGTLGSAERIAEVMFPGFTARMWRPRFLTFAAVAALVSKRAKVKEIGSEDGGLSFRLGFERLFVSSIVRQHNYDPENWERATRRLPGSLLARRALQTSDTPLGRNNFLKGQAVNGPFGVTARLARNLDIVDEEDHLSRNGEDLILAWSADEGLPGLLDEEGSSSLGRQWLDRFVQETIAHVSKGEWRSSGWSGWHDLAEHLRPDKIGKKERHVLLRFIDNDPIRKRCFELLREPNAVSTYRAAADGGRGKQERQVLVESMLPALSVREREEDKVIDLSIQLADAYEQVAGLLEIAFDGIRWGLTFRGSQAKPEELKSDKLLSPVLGTVCRRLQTAVKKLRDLVGKIPGIPQISDPNPIEPLDTIITQGQSAAENPICLIETVIIRHREIQVSKGKGMWIELGNKWTLMPGYGLASDGPPKPDTAYRHPFRISNAFSFLGELGLARVEVMDGET